MNQIKRAKPEESRDVLQKLEEEFSITFPEDAAAFLLANSRGIPVKSTFQLGGFRCHLERFLSASLSNRLNLYTAAVLMHENMPESILLPFAGNGMGDFYCIRFLDGQAHKIVLWRHETYEEQVLCDRFEQLLEAMDLAVAQ